ncbi:hypothetical protein [Flavobacterium ginsenosidimutans]|uniref:hypothetical protein n=1 Tax=Flavobacterium ginsenosidimutans TaxID=687844 RepID=UPI000DABECFB|nr:hypothetical protein [Flavobacterium ginsenosidimutans]KAF2336652.1 hypothetical protein DM444_03970 [Flavobacterium ginsenosidimutans]
MIRKISLLFIIVFLFQSCNIGTSGVNKNENIAGDKREEIKLLNDQLFKAIMSNDNKGVRALLANELVKKNGNEIDNLVKQVSTSFQSKSYRILDEYNVENSTTGISNTIPMGTKDSDFVINYLAMNKDMYVSLLIPNGHDNELLITVIYGKYDNQWKINILYAGQYNLLKKGPAEYYKLAQENYNRSYLIDAINYVSLAKQCLRPASDIIKYQNENEINNFYDNLLKEANSKFTLPLTLESVDSKPKVYSIYPEVAAEGYIPSIDYVTSINLDDTIALKTEKDKMKKEIKNLFSGIYKNKKGVFYRAFSELPDGNKPRKYCKMFDKITK